MKKVYLPVLLELSKELGRLIDLYDRIKPEQYTDENKKNNKTTFLKHAEAFEELDLRMCKAQCERIARKTHESPAEIGKLLHSLLERMYDECRLREFMALSVKQAEYLFPEQPLFGGEVEKKFPAAAFEIEEAGKCLGLDRPTASVFHCMRVLEVGIAATTRCLGIPDPIKPSQRNWGMILKSIKDELDRRASGKLPAAWASPDKAFFEEVYASLDAVRNPWRNATMHVENKYTDEEAEHIFTAVRAFMKKLASRMDENGEPKCA